MASPTKQQILDAQSTLRMGPAGDHRYFMVNPLTGQYELAYDNYTADGNRLSLPESIVMANEDQTYMPWLDNRGAPFQYAHVMEVPKPSDNFGGGLGGLIERAGDWASTGYNGLGLVLAAAGGMGAFNGMLGGSGAGFGAGGPMGWEAVPSSAGSGVSLGAGVVGNGGGGMDLTSILTGSGDAPNWLTGVENAQPSILGTGPSTFSSPFGTALPGSPLDLNTPLYESLGNPFQVAPGSPLDIYTPLGGAAGSGLTLSQLMQAGSTASSAKSLWDRITGGSGGSSGSGGLGGLGGLGALLGAGAGLLSGAKQAGTTTTVQDIPDWLKPYVMRNLDSAQSLVSQYQNNPLLPQAQQEMSNTIAGNYLNPLSNPYLRSTYDQAAKAVTDAYGSVVKPGTDFAFGKTGNAFGDNSGYQETVARNQFGLGQNLANLATNIYGGNYNNERTRQFGAATSAPSFAGQSTQAAFSPFTAMTDLYPNVRSTSQPYFQNPASSALGGALLGSQIGRAFG